MSLAAYLRNGVRPAAEPTYFDLQPRMMRGTEETMQANVPLVPRTSDPYKNKLIPSATHAHHTRQVLGLKPYPFSIRTGIDPGPRSNANANQGYGRHQRRGLAYKLDGTDHTKGPLLKQADSTYAGLNNRIPLPG